MPRLRLLFSCFLALIVAAPSQAQRALRAGGFVDLELHNSSENDREDLDALQIDLYGSAVLSERWSALAEVVALRSLRGDRRDELYEVDLERFFVEYAVSDTFRLEIGQMHNRIIRWNDREHRGRFLQTPIDLPAIARRPQEDGAWPLRFAGLWMSGRLRGPLGVAYGAGVGAGTGHNRAEAPVFGDDHSPALLLSLSMAPDALPGLEAGVAAYAQRLPSRAEPLRERDVTLFANYVNNGTEVRTEWARMNHRGTRTAVLYRTNGYYVLISKRLPGSLERARPYLLVDRLRMPHGETYLGEAEGENAWAAGLRYDLSKRWTVKGEVRSQRARDGDREKLLGMQVGLAF